MSPKIKVLFTVSASAPEFRRLWTPAAAQQAEQYGFEVDLLTGELPRCRKDWNRLYRSYDAIVTSWGAPSFDAEILAGNNRLKIVGHAAGSVADLVSDELYTRNIKVVSANDTMACSVAEWCLTVTLLGFNRMLDCAGIGGTRPMSWNDGEESRCIKDAAIGVWGFGSVARHYVDYLKPLGPKRIMVCSDYPADDLLRDRELEAASLEEVFASSDVIAVLAGLNSANFHRIDAALLRSIRDGAVFINCGRARLVEESALMEELEKNRFKAYLDVFYQEPLPSSSPLHRMPNVFMTPHIGGHGSIGHFVPDVLENLHRFFNGQPLRGEVTRARAATMTSHRQAAIA